MPRTATYRRDEALSQALQLFWRRGYHATSIKDLETALNMRPGSLYAAFGNKETLYREALDAYAEQMGDLLQHHLDTRPSVLAAIRGYLEQLLLGQVNRHRPPARACMIIKTLLEASEGGEPLRRQANRLLGAMETRLTQLLTLAQQRGELDAATDPARLARVIQVQIMGLRTYAQRENTRGHLEVLLDDIFQLLATGGQTFEPV